MRAGAAALTSLEVAIGGGGDTLAGRGDVGVHAQAHRAAGTAPVESGAPEHLIEAFALGLGLDLLGAWYDHRVDVGGDFATLTTAAAARRSPIRELVQDPMNTRSSLISLIGVPA